MGKTINNTYNESLNVAHYIILVFKGIRSPMHKQLWQKKKVTCDKTTARLQ